MVEVYETSPLDMQIQDPLICHSERSGFAAESKNPFHSVKGITDPSTSLRFAQDDILIGADVVIRPYDSLHISVFCILKIRDECGICRGIFLGKTLQVI